MGHTAAWWASCSRTWVQADPLLSVILSPQQQGALWCTFDLPDTALSQGGLKMNDAGAAPATRSFWKQVSSLVILEGRMLAAPTWPKVPPKHRGSLSHVPNWQVKPILTQEVK